MEYTSLYRKYRPDSFAKVIGQDHIIKTLRNQLANGNIGHAYIFTGTRGTGKTSVAKIFARAVNCLSPLSDGSPCGKCANCERLLEPGNLDIYEIDAASNNSVEDVRDIIEKINFPPTVGRYKVYIVDEVHMLSKSAFNALLKTLEEPPEHAIFILATTEIHMVPATILSRCLRFDFRLVPTAVIARHIRGIFDEMKVEYEVPALGLIASAGAGSVRDALSVADMCMSYCGGKITYDGVISVLGVSNPQTICDISEAILKADSDKALRLAAQLADMGKSIPVLAGDVASLMSSALYIKLCSDAKSLLSLPDGVYENIARLAAQYSEARLLGVMKIMSSLEGEFRYSSQHRIIFEAALVQACMLSAAQENNERLAQKVDKLEKEIAELKNSNFKRTPAITDALQVWERLASELIKRNCSLLKDCLISAKFSIDGNLFKIVLDNDASYTLVSSAKNKAQLMEAFEALSVSKTLKLVIEEAPKIAEDKTLPYIKDMFGGKLEII